VFDKLAGYMHWWMLPMLAVFLAAWLIGCPYMLRSALHRKLQRRRPPQFGQCLVQVMVSGACGALAGLVVFYLIFVIGARLEVRLWILGAIVAAMIVPVVTVVLLMAMLEMPLGDTVEVSLRPLGALMILGLVLALGAGIPARLIRQRDIRRAEAVGNLVRIYQAIVGSYERVLGRPPTDLRQLVEKNYLDAKYLISPNFPDRQVGFFYYPTPTVGGDERQSQKLFACEFLPPGSKGGRAVIFVDGRAEWVPGRQFERLLALRENEQFAQALRHAEQGR